MAHETESHDSGELHHEPLPLATYVKTLVGLLFLTFLTVLVAQFHFGEFNLIVAMAIAVAKASLVVLFFMNLLHDHDRLNAVAFVAGLFFLVVFVLPTMWDKMTRDELDPMRAQPLTISRPGYPPGVAGQPPVGSPEWLAAKQKAANAPAHAEGEGAKAAESAPTAQAGH